MSLLQTELSAAQADAYNVRNEKDKCIADHGVEQKRLQEALDTAVQERRTMEAKWQTEFEQLRTVNSGFCAHIYNFQNIIGLMHSHFLSYF